MGDGDNDVYMAKLAEQAERYDEMVEYMKKVAQAGDGPLRRGAQPALGRVQERRRRAPRLAPHHRLDQDEGGGEGHGAHQALRDLPVASVEEELNTICEDILGLLDSNLIAKASSSAEAKVFYLKMKADYYRYLAEFATGQKKTDHSKNAASAYDTASETASQLAPTHPIRLGLALNYSVFLYEVQAESSKACDLAKQAFDEAIAELDTLDEESYKDSTLIMQLLRDNLTLWTSDDTNDQ